MQYSTEFKEMGTNFRLPSQTDRTVLPRWVNQIPVITVPNSRKVMYYLTSSGHESAWVNFHSFFFLFLIHNMQAGNAKVATITPVFNVVLHKKCYVRCVTHPQRFKSRSIY